MNCSKVAVFACRRSTALALYFKFDGQVEAVLAVRVGKCALKGGPVVGQRKVECTKGGAGTRSVQSSGFWRALKEGPETGRARVWVVKVRGCVQVDQFLVSARNAAVSAP
ncbi:MAG: hypothetical protein GY820_28075 [Gammaproteobacteria bacterium]|nr:hypothetical protein [Gammaproteobacteria bacterium]